MNAPQDRQEVFRFLPFLLLFDSIFELFVLL